MLAGGAMATETYPDNLRALMEAARECGFISRKVGQGTCPLVPLTLSGIRVSCDFMLNPLAYFVVCHVQIIVCL